MFFALVKYFSEKKIMTSIFGDVIFFNIFKMLSKNNYLMSRKKLIYRSFIDSIDFCSGQTKQGGVTLIEGSSIDPQV